MELENRTPDAQAEVHTALAEAIGRPVLPLAGAAAGLTAAGAVLCDVWHAPGDFPTVVDCYAPPETSTSTPPSRPWPAASG